MFREWASRAGWLPAPTAGGTVATAPERKTERPEDAEALRGEIATLREQLRTLEERLEKPREK